MYGWCDTLKVFSKQEELKTQVHTQATSGQGCGCFWEFLGCSRGLLVDKCWFAKNMFLKNFKGLSEVVVAHWIFSHWLVTKKDRECCFSRLAWPLSILLWWFIKSQHSFLKQNEVSHSLVVTPIIASFRCPRFHITLQDFKTLEGLKNWNLKFQIYWKW